MIYFSGNVTRRFSRATSRKVNPNSRKPTDSEPKTKRVGFVSSRFCSKKVLAISHFANFLPAILPLCTQLQALCHTVTLPHSHTVQLQPHYHTVTVYTLAVTLSHTVTVYTQSQSLCHNVTVYTLTVAQSLCTQFKSQSLCHTATVFTATLPSCHCVHSHSVAVSRCTHSPPHCVHIHSHSVTVYTLIATLSRCTQSKSHSLCHL